MECSSQHSKAKSAFSKPVCKFVRAYNPLHQTIVKVSRILDFCECHLSRLIGDKKGLSKQQQQLAEDEDDKNHSSLARLHLYD
jgi:hypothetical protein